MISRSLIELVFSSSSIERWNDHPRPVQFTEMAKQAHKFIIAYVIGRHEEDQGIQVNWQSLIEGSVFEFLHRVVVTDIKPPIFHRLMSDETQRNQLNRWVMENLRPLLAPLPGGISTRCEEYFSSDEACRREKRYLKAAHYLATKWEFDFIYLWSSPIYRIERTKEEIYKQVMEHRDIGAVREILSEGKPTPSGGLADFVSLVGQLRFQKRWAQTPRIPQTSVLGHLLLVAILSWLVLCELGGSDRRRYNAFYGGLFHDLPEVLTRDIVSPVKRSVKGLDQMIKDLEMEAISQEVLPLIPASWHDEILSFVKDEFENRIRNGHRVSIIGEILPSNLDGDIIDGKIVEACDKLAAFIEASESIRIGIKSVELFDGKRNIYEKYSNRTVNGYPVGILFDYFR